MCGDDIEEIRMRVEMSIAMCIYTVIARYKPAQCGCGGFHLCILFSFSYETNYIATKSIVGYIFVLFSRVFYSMLHDVISSWENLTVCYLMDRKSEARKRNPARIS